MKTYPQQVKGMLDELNTSNVSATDHPNRTRFYNGHLPPPGLIAPQGAMLAVQTLVDEQGTTTGGLVLPDGGRDVWITPKFVVVAAGPECKWTERGDVVLCSPNLAKQLAVDVVRVDGWELMLLHEHQTQGRVPGLRVLVKPRALDHTTDERPAGLL